MAGPLALRPEDGRGHFRAARALPSAEEHGGPDVTSSSLLRLFGEDRRGDGGC